MKRRDFVLKSVVSAAAAALIPSTLKGETPGQASLTGNPLRFPPVLQQGQQLTLSTTNAEVWPGQLTEVIALNGSYPGPTIKVKRGEEFSVVFNNQHSEEATIHWHGLLVPELMDGQPKDAVLPGASYTYTFAVTQRAGTYFYHSHAHHITGKHVYKGFAGFFIIEDDDELQLGLPAGEFDVPLVIQDRRSANIPQFTYQPAMMDNMLGYMGDTALVNGTPDAYLEVHKTLYRFRLLNGSNARIYHIAFSDNTPFTIIGTDSGLKDEAVQAGSVYLAPGERLEILADFSNHQQGTSVNLISLAFTAPGLQGDAITLMRFDITGTQSSGGVIPQSLPAITYYNYADKLRTREFVLSQGTMATGMHRINDKVYDMHRIDEVVQINELEEWKFINTTNLYHPMHIHGVMFQVYSRGGSTTLGPNDKGWKDTVLVFPNETVGVLAKFTDHAGIFLMHCHILEHEDMGMMMNFRIEGEPTTGTDDEGKPSGFALEQNYPNPFNPSTVIGYAVGRRALVELELYDIQGSMIARPVSRVQEPGSYSVRVDFSGQGLPSGMYIYRMKATAEGRTLFMKSGKMEYIK